MPAPSGGAALRPASPQPRALSALLMAVPGLRSSGDLQTTVTGCTHDSRAVQPGDLYAALPGARVHGANFLQQAVQSGAVAVLTDEEGAAQASSYDLVVIVADSPRDVLGKVASWVHGDPSAELLVLGVTGTNGKTTTAFLIEAGLRAAGRRTALLGTVVTRIGDDEVASVRTTPEATDLHAFFAVMREREVDAVAMEVSSHALALGRVDGVHFDTVVFTNLSQDHLDFHSSMEAYYQAKASLFAPDRTGRGVVCVDDASGRRLAASASIPITTYGEGGDWSALEADLRTDGSTFRLVGPTLDEPASVRLPGAFNVSNTVGALACLLTAGVDVDDAVHGVAELPGVPGRMELVDVGQGFTALVDYAHTPDAVETLLRTLQAVTPGRVLVVLGCGGERDRAKRPLMGRAAVVGADVAILTSDNPRSEDPLTILAEMTSQLADLPGIAAIVEPDRRRAIELAVAQARPGDCLVVAGRGHESSQDIAGVVSPFDDRTVLREALQMVGS